MKRLLTLHFIFLSCTVTAQHKPDTRNTTRVVGVYNRSSKGDPQGSSYLYILENNRYVIPYFGGAQVGGWRIIQDNVVLFIPDFPEQPYYLYGRHDTALKDSLRIFFGGFSENATFISFGETENGISVMKQVFNNSPNCMSFPNVYTFREKGDSILFADFSRDRNRVGGQGKTYTFDNKNHYNDFIAYYSMRRRDDRPSYALYKNGKLYFNKLPDSFFDDEDTSRFIKELTSRLIKASNGKEKLNYGDDPAYKMPLPQTGRDIRFVRELAEVGTLPDEGTFNPFYKEYNPAIIKDTQHYTYNTQKKAYIDTSKYKEGEEFGKSSDLYNSSNIIYLFKVLKIAAVKQRQFWIDKKPLFEYKCK